MLRHRNRRLVVIATALPRDADAMGGVPENAPLTLGYRAFFVSVSVYRQSDRRIK